MWQYNQSPDSDELMHYGVMGMKWGIRRYQNADGSLTAAGKKRYGSVGESYTKMKQAKAKYKSDAKQYSKAYNKATSTASWFQGREVRKAQTADLIKTAEQAEASRLKYKQSKSNYKETLKKENSQIAKRKAAEKAAKKISNKKISQMKSQTNRGKYVVSGLLTSAITGLGAKSLGFDNTTSTMVGAAGYAMGRSRAKFNDEMRDYYKKNHIIK